MQKLFIPCALGHETIEFDVLDADAGDGVAVANRLLSELVENHKAIAMTRKVGDSDYHKISSFNEVQDETTFKVQLQGG